QAGFYVMMGTEATMPGVLVEVAFISNPYEEKLLKRTSFRKKTASAIFEGIKTFKMQKEQGMGYGGK
ncbi:MAG: N-acetylmuramoyl-L-alanine amidase, partial [Candidatus Latescibacteria bacterium]|nr:N-acetylmuramoyl-L-alanine amidase [Candidatus Latescibacterota bacterium]